MSNYDEPEEIGSLEEEDEEESIVYDEDSLNLVEAFKKKYNRTPAAVDLQGYDSARLIIAAVTKRLTTAAGSRNFHPNSISWSYR